MPKFKSEVKLYGHIIVEAEDAEAAAYVVYDMDEDEIKERFVPEWYDSETDEFPEEV